MSKIVKYRAPTGRSYLSNWRSSDDPPHQQCQNQHGDFDEDVGDGVSNWKGVHDFPPPVVVMGEKRQALYG